MVVTPSFDGLVELARSEVRLRKIHRPTKSLTNLPRYAVHAGPDSVHQRTKFPQYVVFAGPQQAFPPLDRAIIFGIPPPTPYSIYFRGPRNYFVHEVELDVLVVPTVFATSPRVLFVLSRHPIAGALHIVHG